MRIYRSRRKPYWEKRTSAQKLDSLRHDLLAYTLGKSDAHTAIADDFGKEAEEMTQKIVERALIDTRGGYKAKTERLWVCFDESADLNKCRAFDGSRCIADDLKVILLENRAQNATDKEFLAVASEYQNKLKPNYRADLRTPVERVVFGAEIIHDDMCIEDSRYYYVELSGHKTVSGHAEIIEYRPF